jgi:ferredoxin
MPADDNGLELAFYGLLNKTKFGAFPKKVVKVFSEKDLKEDGVPRFENFRGAAGEVVYDLRDFKGIVSSDDTTVTVRAGTTWEEVVSQFPDVASYSIAEFSVGGSLYFGDPIFGLNEFRSLKSALAEVTYFKNGSVKTGHYEDGSIPLLIRIKREKTKLVWKELITKNFNDIISLNGAIQTAHVAPFRSLEVWKTGDTFRVIAVYTPIRESLVGTVLSTLTGWTETRPTGPESLKGLGWPLYWYFGITQLNEFPSLERILADPDVAAVLRLERTRMWVSLFSFKPLKLPPSLALTPYSDVPESEAFTNGCVLCGKCVSVCPHAELKRSFAYSPMGFFALHLAPGLDVSDVATCEFCGICENVCPVKLPILSYYSTEAKFREPQGPLQEEGMIEDVVLVVTADTKDLLKDEIEGALLYLGLKGEGVSLYVIPSSLASLVKSGSLPPDVKTKLNAAEKIYTLTPELDKVLRKSFDESKIALVHQLILGELIEHKPSLKVHYPCYLRNDKGACSYAFYDLATGSKTEAKLDYEVTLCSLASVKTGVPSAVTLYMKKRLLKDALVKLKSEVENLYTELLTETYVEDLDWYAGISEEAREWVKVGAMLQAIKDKSDDELEKVEEYFELVEKQGETTKILHKAIDIKLKRTK